MNLRCDGKKRWKKKKSKTWGDRETVIQRQTKTQRQSEGDRETEVQNERKKIVTRNDKKKELLSHEKATGENREKTPDVFLHKNKINKIVYRF